MIEKALAIVRDYVSKYTELEPAVFVVWQAKVLQNFKCLISTTLPRGMYFELTYDGEKGCWYLDAYQKVDNREIADDRV